ncbi:ABC multidrug transporter [Fusarium albosuccineum]|uniref:ABC multidrug transporter n=1 Tax=Fusarium albosuccineum TaxID=1237068 RepID=A0A8H4PG42_9HYPO|nr:ABC multidrug transporter [Fusarium albosuccineum]
MPSYLRQGIEPLPHTVEHDQDQDPHVFLTAEIENTIGELHREISRYSQPASHDNFADFEKYLRRDQDQDSPGSVPLSVCFKSVTAYGQQTGRGSVKTLKDAIWEALTLKSIYNAVFGRLISPPKMEDGNPLIRDFTGLVKNGQMMLVLGNPGSGCSTFLRTISGEHASFLGVKGSIDYSGISLEEVNKKYRGAVAYIPEDDIHLPTLTVRQTLEFALKNKSPKRLLGQVPRFLDEYGRIFGMTHVMDTLVGNEFIRGVSGGERKRVSILESLASDSSVQCWDGSTRGLDAASALDYIRSLRIMTDACDRATVVSLYQASDAIYNLMDKLLLIDEGRMLYQGPACEAEHYFNALGYERLPRQTMSDFLTSITAGKHENMANAQDEKFPRGAIDLERAFRASQAFKAVQDEVQLYEADVLATAQRQNSVNSAVTAFKDIRNHCKSRFVSAHSSYNTSFVRQALLCTRREFWQLRGHLAPFLSKFICILSCAFLLGSMFYNMPVDTAGVYSRGGFSFYCAALVAWFQYVELENALHDRSVMSRQKRFAIVRPSAVIFGKFLLDLVTVFLLTFCFAVVAYFLGGMRAEAGAFFAFLFSTFLCAIAFTSYFRVFGAASPRLDIALRYGGLLLLIAIVGGGYLRSVDRLMSDAPWVGWLAYVTPVLYSFEIIMAVEFHNRDFPCSSSSMIPSGESYNNSEFQSCAYKGMSSGQMSLQGDDYLASQFGFSFDNIGRDFGILILFTVGLLLINMWLVEAIDWADGVGGAVDEKPLLKDVSGFCEPGKLTALVGASGAGKSTLMSVLTQQSTGTLQGEMMVDGKPIGPDFGQSIGYCQQMDVHVETSTVREAFEFSALLRQSKNTPKADKSAYVDEVLEILDMTHLQDAVIRTLSLEQKKRTTIGVELCAKPSMLLFLDEPTSGLDGQGAMSIVALLKRLASNGQSIICTIHQASQDQFEMFDRVLAINQGRVYYFGEVGCRGKSVLEYVSKQGISVEPDKNVADLLIEITSGTWDRGWCDIWDESPDAAAVLQRIDEITASKTSSPADDFGNHKASASAFASSTTDQIYHLTKRTLIQYWRTPDYIYSRLYCSFFHAILNGLAFLQLNNSVEDMQNRIFSCFLVLMLIPEFINACAMMFEDNRNVWLAREYPSRIYGWFAFSTAQIVAEIPFALIGGVLFYVLFYFLVGHPLGAPAGYTFLMMIMFHLFSTSWGQWIAALSADATMAANIMPFFIVMCEFFNGVLQPQSLMPDVWAYTMYYVSPFTYWISGIIAMVLSPTSVKCLDSELISFRSPSNTTCGEYAQDWLSSTTGYLSDPDAIGTCGYCQYATGKDYLSTIDVAVSDAWPYLGIFALFTATNYVSVYLWVYIKSVKNWLPW